MFPLGRPCSLHVTQTRLQETASTRVREYELYTCAWNSACVSEGWLQFEMPNNFSDVHVKITAIVIISAYKNKPIHDIAGGWGQYTKLHTVCAWRVIHVYDCGCVWVLQCHMISRCSSISSTFSAMVHQYLIEQREKHNHMKAGMIQTRPQARLTHKIYTCKHTIYTVYVLIHVYSVYEFYLGICIEIKLKNIPTAWCL